MTSPTIDGAMMTDEQRQALGQALTNYLADLEIEGFDCHDSRDVDDLIDRAIAPHFASKPAAPMGFTIKRVEGHGWYIDPPSGSRWVAYEGTPAGELMQALSAAPAAPAQSGDTIYQTCFIQGQWRDVDRAEYDRAKGLRADLARIVYAAPQPSLSASAVQDDERAAFDKFWRDHAGMDPGDDMDAEETASVAFSAGIAFARAASAQAKAASARTYTTQPGESVMGIALRQCGDEAEWRHILACNPKFAELLPSDYFPVGTVLTLPPQATATQPAQTRALTDEQREAIEHAVLVAGHCREGYLGDVLNSILAAQPASGGDQ